MNNRDPYIGQVIGNYRIKARIDCGSFGCVYLAQHTLLPRTVAIKLLHSAYLNSSQDQEKFLQEARILETLKHPHIIQVIDFHIHDKTPYLVMPYAPGGTLRARHPKGTRLPLSTVVTYVKQITAALQHAHDRKQIHRDIKPENFLLDENDQVLLSDFGIAVIAHSSRSLSTQNMAGTAAYMAPEQIRGKPRPASDQYALGITVYEWLTGRHPFTGSYTELISQHLFAKPPPFAKELHIPSAVEIVVRKALEKEPKQRFVSIQAFANALEDAYQQTMIADLSTSPLLPDILDEEFKDLGSSNELRFIAQPNLVHVAQAVATPDLVKQAVIVEKAEKKSVFDTIGDFSSFLSSFMRLEYKFCRYVLLFDMMILPVLLGVLANSWWLFGGSLLCSFLGFVIIWSIGKKQNYKLATMSVTIFAILWGLLAAVCGLGLRTTCQADYITITIVLSIVAILFSGCLHLIIVPNFRSYMMGKDNAK